MPLNIVAIRTKFVEATNGQVGFVATIETLFIAISSKSLSRIVNKVNRKNFFLIASLLVMLDNLLTIFSLELNLLIVSRMIAGLGSGAIVATVVATIARGSNGQMTFALLNSGVGVMGIMLPFLLPIIIKSNGMEGAYSLHFLISLMTLFFLYLITLDDRESDEISSLESYQGVSGWIAMLGTALIFLAHAGMFSFSAKIGESLGISVTKIGYIFMSGGVLTIIGPLMAGFIGQRFGSLIPCLILTVILLITGIIISNITAPIFFYMAMPLFAMVPMVLTPFFLGAIAKLDPTGGLAAAHPAFATMGSAAGPVVMGYVADWQGFTRIGRVVLTVILVGAPLISIALLEADRK